MDPVVIATCAIIGAFMVGVIAGIRLGVDHPIDEPIPLRLEDEPPSAVGELRRLRAPFGVSPLGRPWDGDRDGWA